MILRILAGSVIALGLGFATEQAHAAQTFLCEDGRILRIATHDLERVKRVEPCVAAALGLKIETVPLPVRRPKQAAAPQLKGTKAIARTKPGTVGALAGISASYRNVRIINARPGSSGWFRHTR